MKVRIQQEVAVSTEPVETDETTTVETTPESDGPLREPEVSEQPESAGEAL